MDSMKVEKIASRLFKYEIDTFIIGVSSGLITPASPDMQWRELKKKVQCNSASEADIRRLVDICKYEPLEEIYALMDELK